MRTTAWIVLALVPVAALAAPALLGLVAERQSDRLVARLDARPGITVELESFRRGWFSSQARHRARIALPPAVGGESGDPLPPLDALEFVADSHYRHGPLPRGRLGLARIDTALEVTSAQQSGPSPTLRATTRFGLAGGLRARLELPATEWRPRRDYGEITWQGGEVRIRTDGALRRVEAEARAAPLRFRDAAASGELEHLLVKLSLRRRDGLWTGDGRVETQGLHVWTHIAPRQPTQIDGLVGDWSLRSRDALLEAHLDAAAEHLQFAGADGRRVRIDGGAGRLDPDALGELVTLLASVLHNGGRGLVRGTLPAVPALLPPGPWLSVRTLVADLPVGTVSSTVELQLPELRPARATPARAAFGASLDAQLRLPPSLLAPLRAQPGIGRWVDVAVNAGALVRDGDSYRLDAHYDSGLLVINGRALPVPVPD